MKTNKIITIFLLFLTIGILIFRIILALKGHYLEHISGSWAALAVDFSNGILYRPIFHEGIGTGGTRWMPLYFVLHGAMIKITGNTIYTGLVLSFLSSGLLIAAIVLILKHYKIKPLISVIIIALLLSSNTLITAMTAVRGDILAASLNIWGLYYAVTSDNKPVRIILSCLFFSLTIITKITSIFGIATVVIWLLYNNSKKNALNYFGIFSLITILFLIVIQLVSSGRFISIFTLCAQGGTTITDVIKLPFKFIRYSANTDQGSLIILTFALTILINKGSGILRSRHATYLALTLAFTLVIFASAGTGENHLIDLHIASVLVIAASIHEYEINTALVIKCSFIVIIFSCLLNSIFLSHDMNKKPLLTSMKETAILIDKSDSLISENPWLPIIMKRDVYILDPWMFRVIDREKLVLFVSFYQRLDKGQFDCVVFDKNPLDPWIPKWFDYSHFGRNFLNHVFNHYKFRDNHDLYYIYTPL